MNYLRKIIKEEIGRVLSESVLYDEPQADVFKNKPVAKDDIMYGEMFANDNLQVDIDNLNEYKLLKYEPKTINQEIWSFNLESTSGNMLIVDVVRVISGGKNSWSMTFAIQERGFGKIPEIKKLVENVEGYDNFTQAVNLQMAKDIDPAKPGN
jgi:hypothetical protein